MVPASNWHLIPIVKHHEGGAWDSQLIVQPMGAQQRGSHLIAFTDAQSLSREKWGVTLGAAIRFSVHNLAVCETRGAREKTFYPQILGYTRLSLRIPQPGQGMIFWLKSDTCTGAQIVRDSTHVLGLQCKVAMPNGASKSPMAKASRVGAGDSERRWGMFSCGEVKSDGGCGKAALVCPSGSDFGDPVPDLTDIKRKPHLTDINRKPRLTDIKRKPGTRLVCDVAAAFRSSPRVTLPRAWPTPCLSTFNGVAWLTRPARAMAAGWLASSALTRWHSWPWWTLLCCCGLLAASGRLSGSPVSGRLAGSPAARFRLLASQGAGRRRPWSVY